MRVPLLEPAYAGKAASTLDALPLKSCRTIRPITNGTGSLKDRYIAVPVVGDSMEGERIFDGDIAIIKLTNEARTGDLIVALTPDGLTVKRFYPQQDGTIILRSANPHFFDQIWEANLVKIQGIVKRVERDF